MLTILLIDDDPDDQLIFTDLLDELETTVQCKTVNNGAEAMAYLETAPRLPSFIFLDLNMPRMSGFQCLTKIKEDERFKHIPVLIYTTSNNPLDEEYAKELGADLFITKTSNFKLLKENLRSVLDSSRVKL